MATWLLAMQGHHSPGAETEPNPSCCLYGTG